MTENLSIISPPLLANLLKSPNLLHSISEVLLTEVTASRNRITRCYHFEVRLPGGGRKMTMDMIDMVLYSVLAISLAFSICYIIEDYGRTELTLPRTSTAVCRMWREQSNNKNESLADNEM